MVASGMMHTRLRAVGRRIRAIIALRWSSTALMWTMVAMCIWLGLSRFGFVSSPGPGICLGLGLAAIAISIVLALVWPISTMDVARLTDRRTHSNDRLSSAVSLSGSAEKSEVHEYVAAEAESWSTSFSPSKAFGIRIPREFWVALGLSILLCGLFYLPESSLFMNKNRKNEILEVKAAGLQIERIGRDTTKTAEQKKLSESAKSAKDAKKLGEEMKKGSMDKKTAMIKLAKLTKEIEAKQKSMAQANAPQQKPLSQAAKEVKDKLAQQQKAVEEAVKKAEPMKKPDGTPMTAKEKAEAQKKASEAKQAQMSPAMKDAQQALQQLSQALMDQNAEKQNESLQKLADQMSKGQMKPQEMQQLMEQLKMVANALKGTQLEKAGDQLQKAAQMMHQVKLDPETLKKLADMMRKAGGQCKGGGPQELDAKTLAELLQALKDGKLCLGGGGSGSIPIPIPGKGKGSGGKGGGSGHGGSGDKTGTLVKDVSGNPKIVAVGKDGQITADSRATKEFLKYAAMGHKDSKFSPNTQVNGTRNSNPSELQMNFKGDPDGQYTSGTPLYQAYVSGKRSLENPVNKENIPAAYRKQVKEYFESINPGK